MDLALLAARHDCQIVVADDRPEKLDIFASALRSLPLREWLDPGHFEMRLLEMLARPTLADDAPYDLWVTTSASSASTSPD